MRYCLLILVLLVALLSATPVRALPALSALNVRLADLPAGAALAQEVSGPPEKLAAPTLGLDPHLLAGMALGDGRVFTLDTTSTSALLAVIGRYSSAASAHAALQVGRTRLGSSTTLSLGQVGDERFGGRGLANTLSPQDFAAGAFRRGTYLVYLILVSPPKTFPFTRLPALARLVDTRILHAR